MITRSETLATFRAFFEAKAPFASAAALTGHASTGRPDVFIRWYAVRSAEDQAMLVSALTDGLLSGEELRDVLPQAGFLLVEIALFLGKSFPPESVAALERQVQRGDLRSAWTNDVESDEDHLKDFRTRWRFALCLWNVLYVLKSPVATDALHLFRRRAKDPNFLRALELAKRVRDNPIVI